MRILILEDEPKVADFLNQSLRCEGYQTLCLASVDELSSIGGQVEEFDLAIFDRMLGVKDSLAYLAEFKRKFSRCAVLVLSVINTPEERAQALDAGADDYMGKPYSLLELSARLRALKRRDLREGVERRVFVLGDLQLDCVSHRVFFKGKRLDFSAKEFNLLSLLIRRPGQVFNKYQILDQVWDTQLDLESNVVETTIKNIRRKLEGDSVNVEIHSRRNVGYWIEA
ncbi:MAG: response regulator transcription factor [Oligoflexia bacterium]|nr:response regulator transcription factor [Oligoflexia bacterium]